MHFLLLTWLKNFLWDFDKCLWGFKLLDIEGGILKKSYMVFQTMGFWMWDFEPRGSE